MELNGEGGKIVDGRDMGLPRDIWLHVMTVSTGNGCSNLLSRPRIAMQGFWPGLAWPGLGREKGATGLREMAAGQYDPALPDPR